MKFILQPSRAFITLSLIATAAALVLSALLLIPNSAEALSATTISASTVDGGSASTVAPGATVTGAVTVNVGTFNWRGTSWRIDSGSETCVDTPNYGSGSPTENVSVTAPATLGAHDVTFTVYATNNCLGGGLDSYTLTNGIVVSLTPSTDAATGITFTDATLNGTNGPGAATGHSFWVSTSTFSTASPTVPSGVYSTQDLGAIAANAPWSAALSSVTTSGYPSNMPAITPGTTYYFAAWVEVGGTWYPGSIQSFTTTAIPSCSSTDTLSDTTFDTFSDGNVNGQLGWSSTGPFDQAIVDNTYGYSSFGCKSLRLSNAVTSGSFGDQTFAAPMPDSVGEADATAGSFAVGTRYTHYEAQFDIASADPTSEQSGLAVSVSPDRGDGSRMSYLSFADTSGGIDVTFYDVQQPGACTPSGCANFVPTDLGTFDRSVPHTVKFVIDTLDGPGNDVVSIYIDGSLVHTGTTWEDYYRYDPESSAEQSPRILKTILFRAGGTAAAGTSGKGFLFDNLSLSATVLPDTTRPTLVYDYPSSGAYATSSLPASLTATDSGSGIASLFVHVYDSLNTLLGSCGSGNGAVGGLASFTYTCTLDTSVLADGDYSFKSGTFDVAGNNQTVSLPFTVDNTKPTVTMTDPVDSATYAGDVSAAGTATDAGSGIDHVAYTVTKITALGGTYVSSVDSGTAAYNGGTHAWTFDETGLADGFYRFKVQAFDAAGNYKYLYHDIEVVNLVPALAITMPSIDGDYATSTYAFAAQYDNGVTTSLLWAIRSGTSCSNSAGTVAGNVDGHHDASTLSGVNFSATLDTSAWADGEYCFVVNDGHGLRPTRIFNVDNTAPDAPTLVSPANNAVVNGTTLTNSWSDPSTDISGYHYESYNDSGASSLRFAADYTTTSKTATNVANTTFWWRVKAEDLAGNWSAWSNLWKLTVDNSVPSGSSAGHLVLVKHTTNGSDSTFGFEVGNTSATTTVSLPTSGGTGTSSVIDLDPGTYNVVESSSADWALAGVSCDSGSPSAIANGKSVTIATGVTVTCTFTNEPASTTYETVYRGSLATSTDDVLANPAKWFFYNDENDQIDDSLGAFVSGPGAAPLGEGSAQISVTGTERRNLATYQFAGTMLGDITALTFDTYNPSAGNGGSANRSAYLNFNIDFDGSNTWQHRIAFVPSQNGTVTQNAWQEWDAIDGGNAMYSFSGSTWPGTATPGTTLRSWSDITASYPDARILAADGWLGMRVGEPYSDGYTENLDAFSITVDDGSHATTTRADFEPDTGTETTITNAGSLATPTTVGSPYDVEWSVTPVSGSATPTGVVTIYVNGSSSGGCSAAASAGSCQITPSSSGTVTLKAAFDGDPGFLSSDSSATIVTHEIDDAPVTTSSTTGGGGGGGNGLFSLLSSGPGGGSPGNSGLVLGASTTGVAASCDANNHLIVKNLGIRKTNDTDQVELLQEFLNENLGLSLPVSGFFGQLTFGAVKSFQGQHVADILTPWGLTEPTGFVGPTTRRMIDIIACGADYPIPEVR